MQQLTPEEIPELLARLVDKSLVQVDAHGRFDFLQTMRSFAQEELLDREGGTLSRNRHLEYFHRLSLLLGEQIFGPGQLEVWRQYQLEADNIRLAVEWGVVNPESWTMAAEIVNSLFSHTIFGVPSQAASLIALALDNAPAEEEEAFAWLLSAHAHHCRLFQSPEALHVCDQAIDMGRRTGSAFAVFLGMLQKAGFWMREGKSKESIELIEQAVQMVRTESGNRARFTEYTMLTTLANDAVINNELDKAREYFDECRRLCDELRTPGALALLNGNLAHFYNRVGDLKASYHHMRESLDTTVALNDVRNLAGSVASCASGFWVAGDYDMAANVLGCGYGIWEKSNIVPDLVDAVIADEWRKRLIEAMGEDAFQDAFDRGKSISAKEIVATIMANPEPWVKG